MICAHPTRALAAASAERILGDRNAQESVHDHWRWGPPDPLPLIRRGRGASALPILQLDARSGVAGVVEAMAGDVGGILQRPETS